MLFSDRLRLLRRRSGHSQSALAEVLSISRMAYTQYESGHREPNLETLRLLSQFYNVSLDYLLGNTDLPRLPELSAHESYLLSQIDRLAEERRQQVFQSLQHELGLQILSEFSSFNQGCGQEDSYNTSSPKSRI